jgi:hypothetical protein
MANFICAVVAAGILSAEGTWISAGDMTITRCSFAAAFALHSAVKAETAISSTGEDALVDTEKKKAQTLDKETGAMRADSTAKVTGTMHDERGASDKKDRPRKRLMNREEKTTTTKEIPRLHHADATAAPDDAVLSRVEIGAEGHLMNRSSSQSMAPTKAKESAIDRAAVPPSVLLDEDDEQRDAELDELEAMAAVMELDRSLAKKKDVRRRSVACAWSQWQQGGQCSKTCGGGKVKQTRHIKTKAAHGGDPCSGNGEQYVDCDNDDCPTTTTTTTKPPTTTTAEATRMMGMSLLTSFLIVKIGLDAHAWQ